MILRFRLHTAAYRVLALGLTLLVAACSSVPERPTADEPPPSTQIFLATLDLAAGTIRAPRNITQHAGYNNQPSFVNDGSALLFVSNRSGSTNVYRYAIATSVTQPVTATTENLYSPMELPDGSGFSAVRVVTPNANGAESKEPPIWRYGWDGKPTAPMTDVRVVGYYAWVNAQLAAFFVVDADGTRNANTAVLADRLTGKTRLLTNKPGRWLGRTPDGLRASFVDKTTPQRWVVAAMGAQDKRPVVLVELPTGPAGEAEADRSEDLCWLPDGSLLMAQGNQFLRWDGKVGSGFKPYADLGANPELSGAIKRLAVSGDGTQLAFVVQRKERQP